MTERAISYLLLLAATIAVLLVAIIQPRNTFIQKQRMLEGTNPNLAQACMMSNGMTCDQYREWMCVTQPNYTWNSTTQTCTAPPTTCGGVSCTQEMCRQMGFGFNGTSCSIASSNSGGGTLTDDSGISQKISEGIESKCLDHLAVSNINEDGYEPIFKKYGWFDAVRIPAVQACKRAYLATMGKYGPDALQSIRKLLMNDDAVPKKEYAISGLLYKALEDACGKKELSLTETLDPKTKGGIAKYVTDVLDIITKFNSITSNSPAYLTNPAPFIMQTDSTILSLEKQFADLAAACLPLKIEIPEEKKPEPEKITKEPVVEPVSVVRAPGPEATPSLLQRVIVMFAGIRNKLKGIREQNIETGIERTTVTKDINLIKKDFLYTREVINTFTACLKDGIC